MKKALLILLSLLAPLALAQQPRQDLGALRVLAEHYLQAQSAGLAGTVSITVGALDARMFLAACEQPQAFQQPGARAWGKTTVGLRCSAPTPWTIYVQAQVSVQAEYVAAAVPLAQGQPIDASQLVMLKGDLAALPNGVLTDMAQALGRTSNLSLASGAPLRADQLRAIPVVLTGQAVRVVSSGPGFSVSREGRAIGNAGDGQVVQVRTPGGAILSGVARAGALVEVVF
ncbi:MAG: flagellar basal body P-ring formation chaperone FlgA [Pseudomonadota bacterium]